MKELINDNWESVRLVLPHTFSGKYDKERFATYLETNLHGMGFLALTIGVILLSQVGVGKALRRLLKKEHLQEEGALQTIVEAKGAGGGGRGGM